MSNFVTRVLTALVFGTVFIAGIFFSGLVNYLFAFVVLIGLHEFYGLIFSDKKNKQFMLQYLAGILLYASIIAYQRELIEAKWLSLNILPLVLFFVTELYRKEKRPFDVIARRITGLIYVVLPFSFFVALGYLNGPDYNYQIPMGTIFLLWASDSGAYLVGVRFGKRRLFERISPKKSWEGFFGGLLLSIVISLGIASYFTVLSRSEWISISVLIVLSGTFGDLVESMFKRSIDIKDSGSLLPGHGGILDRFDGLLIAAPVVYLYLLLFL